jgi:hypothetical protein
MKKNDSKLNEFCSELIEITTRALLEANTQSQVMKIITIGVQSAIKSHKEKGE